ncbi:hypothetical protein [Nocardiopsis synnemataformans]|uniref:hypothetical protein n=1 Tax=Nocardiopsis synnemataformans TaxID=61305 RepID=UPI003EBA4666
MLYFSAALLSRALGPLIALFSSPCGRHSTVAGRRRRSTRVRRYAPAPAPAPAAAPRVRVPELAPPSETIPAEAVALVRPYYAAHERLRASANPAPTNPAPAPRAAAPRSAASHSGETVEVLRGLDRAKTGAAVLYQQRRNIPSGDLLGEPAPQFGAARPTSPTSPTKPARYAEWGELASVTRLWIEQRQSQGALA